MHIVIGVITAIAGLIWAFVALQKAGVDLNSLNPFLWYRRAQWKKKYADKPIYSLRNPMDVAGLLLLGVAKCEGEISSEQKNEVLKIFEVEFHMTRDGASDLLLASSYLMRDEVYLVDHLDKILERSGPAFTEDQIESLVSLMQRVARIESPINEEQNKLILATQDYFQRLKANPGTWG